MDVTDYLVDTCIHGLGLAKTTLDNLGEEGRKRVQTNKDEVVTKSDLEISKTLKEYFLNSELNAVFASEEAGQLNNPKNPRYAVFWDELDGTFNYKRGGILPSSIVISAFDYSKNLKFKDVLFGAVLDIRNSDLWFAIRGDGSFFNGKKSFVSNSSEVGKDCNVVLDLGPCPSIDDSIRYSGITSNVWPHNVSSAGFHMAGVASGQFDAYVGPIQKAHELGTGYLLVKEAGGYIVDFQGEEIHNKEFDFNGTYGIIAANTIKLGDHLLAHRRAGENLLEKFNVALRNK